MKILDLISEITFSVYQVTVRITHAESITVQDVGELLRGMPGVLTVTQVTHNSDNNTAVMKVKIITTKQSNQALESFKQNSLKRIPEVKKVEIAFNTVEKKK